MIAGTKAYLEHRFGLTSSACEVLHTALIVITFSQLLGKVPPYLEDVDSSCADEAVARVDIVMREVIDGEFYASNVISLIGWKSSRMIADHNDQPGLQCTNGNNVLHVHVEVLPFNH
jgi:hypothetical protein